MNCCVLSVMEEKRVYSLDVFTTDELDAIFSQNFDHVSEILSTFPYEWIFQNIPRMRKDCWCVTCARPLIEAT